MWAALLSLRKLPASRCSWIRQPKLIYCLITVSLGVDTWHEHDALPFSYHAAAIPIRRGDIDLRVDLYPHVLTSSSTCSVWTSGKR